MQQVEDKRYKLFIGNSWEPSSDGAETEVRDPSTNEVIAHAAAATREDVRKTVDAALTAFHGATWAVTPKGSRSV